MRLLSGSIWNGLVTLLGVFSIFIVTNLQGLGFLQSWEHALTSHLPGGFLGETPRVVLLRLEPSPNGFDSLEIAMALRGLGGLGKFHPQCIVINGKIAEEKGPVPFLPGIISHLQATQGLRVITPQSPSPEARFQSIPLIRYSLNSETSKWPIIEGEGIPGTGDAYLPEIKLSGEDDTLLPLFAKTSNGVSTGSLWWWALPNNLNRNAALLLLGKILILNNYSTLQLSKSGAVSSRCKGEAMEMQFDDFLLQIEKKEQGTISPTFDTFWNKTTVLLGTHDDAKKAALLASLLAATSLRHLSLFVQFLMGIGWVFLLLLFRNASTSWRLILSAFIMLGILLATFGLLHYGILLPFAPGLVAVLFLPLYKR